jgi:glycosyltransferase involved in cell wall biosynthesis
MFHDYRRQSGWLTRWAMPPLAHYMRVWDTVSASRVDHYVANSQAVSGRIRRYYGRDATVIWPPVDVEAFAPVGAEERGDYILMVGELVAYKRPELAVEAFNRMRRKLVVIGGGEMRGRIRRLAGPTVTVLGPAPFADLQHHYARGQALIFPGEEDFGIVPVEAMASGRPVIAYGRGGATETVVPGVSGVIFDEQSVEALIDAVEGFRDADFNPLAIVAHARNFSREVFIAAMREQVDRLMAFHGASTFAAPTSAPKEPSHSPAVFPPRRVHAV